MSVADPGIEEAVVVDIDELGPGDILIALLGDEVSREGGIIPAAGTV